MIFGNPKGGTPLMQHAQTIGIAHRHGPSQAAKAAGFGIAAALNAIATKAATPPLTNKFSTAPLAVDWN